MDVLKVALLFLPLSMASKGQTIVSCCGVRYIKIVDIDSLREQQKSTLNGNKYYYYCEMNTVMTFFCSFLTEAQHVFCHMDMCEWARVCVAINE